MLSIALQHTIRDILARAKTGGAYGIDSEDILQIGTLFGSLNDIQRHLTRRHQRRSLMPACQMTLDIVERAEQRANLEDIFRIDAIGAARLSACQDVADRVLKRN